MPSVNGNQGLWAAQPSALRPDTPREAPTKTEVDFTSSVGGSKFKAGPYDLVWCVMEVPGGREHLCLSPKPPRPDPGGCTPAVSSRRLRKSPTSETMVELSVYPNPLE